MPQIFYIAGIACLSLALLFNLLTRISRPSLQGIDVARIINPSGSASKIVDLRHTTDQGDQCGSLGSGCTYAFDGSEDFILTPSWTRGVAIQPFGEYAIDNTPEFVYFKRPVRCLNALALGLACFKHEKKPIFASLACLVAAFFMFILFIINIVFYAHVRHLVGGLEKGAPVQSSVIPSSAIWLTFVALLLIIVQGGSVFLGHRKTRAEGRNLMAYSMMTSKPGLLGRIF
ncbi:hypothetical protein B0H17DRAFT_1146564 [Mycena rosella]|uniref:Uncharacterized protein n=1 Tax=Mycena rosella TaxID=1033263 RepID=A0AAD7CNT5_MYCRO|nr:hypothetical protein B0H17DRAFT_1146564 [Mycena rosella]